MGMSVSPARAARRAKAKKRQEDRWAAKSGAVTVSQLCQLEDCDGDCGDWHRL
jgi:hypothetical protein